MKNLDNELKKESLSAFKPDKNWIYIYIACYTVFYYILVLVNRPIGAYGVETDFYSAYVVQAREFLNGVIIIDEYRGPFYQMVLAMFSLITGGGGGFYVAGKILNVTCAGLSLLFVWKLMRQISDSSIALLVMIFVSLNLNFARYAFTPGTDMLFFLLYVLSIFLLLRCIEDNSAPKQWFFAGLAVAITYLTRYTGISLFVFALIVLIVTMFRSRASSNTDFNFSKRAAYFLLPIVIIIGSWSVYCYSITGQAFFNKNYQNTALTVYKPDDISKDEWTLKHQNDFNSMAEVISKDLPLFLKKILLVNPPSNLYKDISRLFPRLVGLFVVLGLIYFVITIRRRILGQKLYLISVILLFLQLILIFYSERFSLPLIPFYLFVMVLFLQEAKLSKYNIEIGKFKLFGIILIALGFLNAYNTISILKKEINDVPFEILKVADTAKKELGETLKGNTVMARKPHIAYYLDMEYATTPFIANIDELRAALTGTSSGYYFINEKESENIENVELRKKLLDFNSPPEGFTAVAYSTNPIAVLYRVR